MEMQWLASQGNAEVYRAKVPGGWLVFVAKETAPAR